MARMSLIPKNLPDGRTIYGLDRGETDYLYKEIFEDRVYQFDSAAPLPPEPVVFDVGANIGIFSLFALDHWPGCRLVSFEPVPEVFGALERNVAGRERVTALNVALGERAETLRIAYYPQYTMMSGFGADPEQDRATVAQYVRNSAQEVANPQMKAAVLENVDRMLEGRFEQQLIPVPVRRVGDVLDELGLDRVDLLKVDVEGFELNVLRGIEERYWDRIGSAVVEVADADGELAAIEELCRAHGMRTEVRQVPEYRDTDLYIVFAERG
jgi:FkbM family methyltransferase